MVKIVKSYRVILAPNRGKEEHLDFLLKTMEKVSKFVFKLGPKYWTYHKQKFNKMYKMCRKKFPAINSKIIQNFLQLYRTNPNSLKLKSPISASLIIDSQSFNFQENDSDFSSMFVRFGRVNYPLRGKFPLSKIKDVKNVKQIQIFRKENRKGISKLYLKFSYVVEKDVLPASQNNIVGLDINNKTIVLSNNSFYSTSVRAHRLVEHKKNKMKDRSLENFTKDFVHKLTTQIVNDLVDQGQEVLVLEDLKGLRKSASKKLRTSKGKRVNHVVNSLPTHMFSNFLEYKCLDRNIRVEKINPAYTSKTCSACGSLDTERPQQNSFKCDECGISLHADLNAARNIRLFYTNNLCAASETAPDTAINISGSHRL